jgi:hypothetical protein
VALSDATFDDTVLRYVAFRVFKVDMEHAVAGERAPESEPAVEAGAGSGP